MKTISVLLVLALASVTLQQMVVHYDCVKEQNGTNFTVNPVVRTRRRLQAVMGAEYCAHHVNSRRLQSMIPECLEATRRLGKHKGGKKSWKGKKGKKERKLQAMVKYWCPVVNNWQCFKNADRLHNQC